MIPLTVYFPGDYEGELTGWVGTEAGQVYTVNCIVRRNVRMLSTLSVTSWLRLLSPQSPLDDEPYPDLFVGCYVDGKRVAAKVPSGDGISQEDGQHIVFTGRRISKGKKQKLRFARPSHTDDDVPAPGNLDKLGKVEMIFGRCDRGESRVLGAQEVVVKDWDKSNAELIKMETKKAALISAVTTYGDITPSKSSRVFDSRRDHPDDCGPEGFFKMTLRYGDMQFMEAIGKVPLKIDITPNEPGYEPHNPIDVDHGPAYHKNRTRTYDARDSSVTSQSSQESNSATRIADIQQHISRLEASQNQLRGEKRPHSEVDEEERDLKPDIAGMELMATQLEEAKARDGGFVDIANAVEKQTDMEREDTQQQLPEEEDEKPIVDEILVKPEQETEMEVASQVEGTYDAGRTSQLPPPSPLDEEDQKPDVVDLVALGHQLIDSQRQAVAITDASPSSGATLPPFPMEQILQEAVSAESDSQATPQQED
ncbi:hypothetical protein QFC20_004622 [Naganishia adeliensis]|uniref:Uncharacterized protein n=1 Tax=Naganishia adeliensis TaxID=92952 RepID=A0ACC2VXH9_9TREE|nr:hypothetical protein QFC20_004622 [Naganishia adeliensis]